MRIAAVILLTSYTLSCCAKTLSRTKRIVGGYAAAPPPDANLDNAAQAGGGWGDITTKPIVFVEDDTASARIYGAKEPKKYYSFRGIPYAEPPLNEFRFQRPKRRYPEGDIQATKNGPPCLQPSPNDPKNVVGDEDCLTLNVYTPDLPNPDSKNTELYPVIFWIHGGGYRRGSGLQYDPSDLVMKGTVVVTIQYRLGSLGFLSSNQKDLPGNVGLSDISSALYWTRHYIQNFGGDPEKITIAGQGSGASAGMLLSLSKLTKDWIKGIVAMSGTAISSFAVDSHPKETYTNVTRKSNVCGDVSGVDLVKCLQEANPLEIVQADSDVEGDSITSGGFISGLAELLTPGPVVEGLDDAWSLPNLLENSAINSITQDNETTRVPLLTGVTKTETGAGVKGGWKGDILGAISKSSNFLTEVMPQQLLKVNKGLLSNLQLTGVLSKLFSNVDYLGGLTKTVEAATSELDKVVQLTTDALFNLPMFLTSKVWALTSDTYVYSFEQLPKKSTAGFFLSGLNVIRGSDELQESECSHGEDLIYLFDAKSLDGNSHQYQLSNSEDLKVRDMFTTLVAEFAKNGAPKIPNTREQWPKFSAQESGFMVLSSQPKMSKDFRHCQMALWEGLSEVLSSQKCSMLNLQKLLGAEKGLIGGLTGVNSQGKKVPLLGGGLLGGGKPNLVGGLTNPNNGLLGLGGVGKPAIPNQKNPNTGQNQGILGIGGGNQGSLGNNQGQNSGLLGIGNNQGQSQGLLGIGGNKGSSANNQNLLGGTLGPPARPSSGPNTTRRPGLLGGGGGLLG